MEIFSQLEAMAVRPAMDQTVAPGAPGVMAATAVQLVPAATAPALMDLGVVAAMADLAATQVLVVTEAPAAQAEALAPAVLAGQAGQSLSPLSPA